MTLQLIVIVDDAFIPQHVDVVVGDTVVWENRTGIVHSATRAGHPTFDTGNIPRGQRSAEIPFNTAAANLDYETIGGSKFKGSISVNSAT